jgi:hypothetical protein
MTWGMIGAAGVSLVGGMLGSKGQSGSQTTKQEMDPRLVPYIFGGGGQSGLLGGVQSQMQRSTSPERMNQIDMMRQQGLGLLGGAAAGNPFFAGYSGGALRNNIDPSMIKNGLPNTFQARQQQGLIPSFAPPPAAQPAAAPPAAPQGPTTLEELMAQLQQQQQQQGGYGNMWSNMPGGA